MSGMNTNLLNLLLKRAWRDGKSLSQLSRTFIECWHKSPQHHSTRPTYFSSFEKAACNIILRSHGKTKQEPLGCAK